MGSKKKKKKKKKNGTKLPWKWQHKKRFILCICLEQLKTLWKHAYDEVIEDAESTDMDRYLLCMHVCVYIYIYINFEVEPKEKYL